MKIAEPRAATAAVRATEMCRRRTIRVGGRSRRCFTGYEEPAWEEEEKKGEEEQEEADEEEKEEAEEEASGEEVTAASFCFFVAFARERAVSSCFCFERRSRAARALSWSTGRAPRGKRESRTDEVP